MSFTESINPPLNRVIKTENGIAVAKVRVKSLTVIKQADGAKSLSVQLGETTEIFILKDDECRHLADLLLDKKL